jgi:hypothetical protein
MFYLVFNQEIILIALMISFIVYNDLAFGGSQEGYTLEHLFSRTENG